MEHIHSEVGVSDSKKRCPRCGSRKVIPIVYGYPTARLAEQARSGKVELGGCCLIPGHPERRCKKCGYSWRAEGRISKQA